MKGERPIVVKMTAVPWNPKANDTMEDIAGKTSLKPTSASGGVVNTMLWSVVELSRIKQSSGMPSGWWDDGQTDAH